MARMLPLSGMMASVACHRPTMKVALISMGVVVGLVTNTAAMGFGIRGYVIGCGGSTAPPAGNGTHAVQGTVGQPVTGYSQIATRQHCAGFWCFGGSRVLAVEPHGGESVPAEFALGPVTPNPARDEARFQLALPTSARVTLTVYDVGGRQVGDALSRDFEAGRHELSWRTSDVSAGIYFMRLEVHGVLKAKRSIVIVR